MNGTRLSVCIPGATAAVMVEAARLAESFNLDIWVGDPRAGARPANADDSYVMTTAAAVTAVTTHIRVGVFLTLDSSAGPLRLAEDVGVVDQAARGRLELGLVAPDDTDDRSEWETRARALLGAWHHWPTTTGRDVAVTPAPAQPWMSRLVSGRAPLDAVADRLRGGVVVFAEDGSDATAADLDTVDRRTVLATTPGPGDRSIRDWLAPDPLAAVTALRSAVDRARAHEVLVVLPQPSAQGGARLVDDIEALGIVVGTSLRCSPHHVPLLAPDAWTWLTERRHLHHAPI